MKKTRMAVAMGMRMRMRSWRRAGNLVEARES
jgi:hypothetical protein